jgi:hypothetical protein
MQALGPWRIICTWEQLGNECDPMEQEVLRRFEAAGDAKVKSIE